MSDNAAFWDKQAEEHGAADTATAPDHFYRVNIEIKRILDVLNTMEPETILDIGCGNGFSTIETAKAFPTSMVVGIDLSEKMIEEAKKAAQGVTNVSFFQGDALSISRHQALQQLRFDAVISTRCLINLANWEEQKLAILQMRKLLEPTGALILVENITDGLRKLNTLRDRVGLPPIEQRWHNFYLPEAEFGAFMHECNGKLFRVALTENIGNLYYVISRVIYAKMCALEGKEPEYGHIINDLASKMPNMGDHYACSPNYLIVLENIPEDEDGQPRKYLR
jgi:SAM-dependent methyltransferase